MLVEQTFEQLLDENVFWKKINRITMIFKQMHRHMMSGWTDCLFTYVEKEWTMEVLAQCY